MSSREQSGAVTRPGFDPTGGSRFHPRLRPEPQSIPEHPLPLPPPLTPLSAPPPSTQPLSFYNINYLGPIPRDSNPLPPPSLPPNSPNTASTTAPIPRGTVPRPRPMSLPPPTYSPSSSGTSSERPRHHVEQPLATAQRHSQRGLEAPRQRTTNRVLGDYTLSKTLGAGSMGKVKLAHHNVTGEKVCPVVILSVLLFALLLCRNIFSFLTSLVLTFTLVVHHDRCPTVSPV